MTEKVGKILNQIKKELEGIKNELKKSNVLKIKRYKEWLTMKKKWKKTHSKQLNYETVFFKMTFSIVASNPVTKELCVATMTCLVAVGEIVPMVIPSVGSTAVQAKLKPSNRFKIL